MDQSASRFYVFYIRLLKLADTSTREIFREIEFVTLLQSPTLLSSPKSLSVHTDYIQYKKADEWHCKVDLSVGF